MYALFTAIPLVGHVNPLLRQAEEMQRRGWRVAFASTREIETHVCSESPYIVVVDMFSSAGLSAADAAGVPSVVNNPDLLAAILAMAYDSLVGSSGPLSRYSSRIGCGHSLG